MVECGKVWCLREDIKKEEKSTETLIQSSDHREKIALAQQVDNSRRLRLKGWTSYQNCKGRKPSKLS